MGAGRPKSIGGAYLSLIRAALFFHHEHPEITFRKDALLQSLNARLGTLLVQGGYEDPGHDLAPLGREWIADLLELKEADSARVREEPEWQQTNGSS